MSNDLKYDAIMQQTLYDPKLGRPFAVHHNPNPELWREHAVDIMTALSWDPETTLRLFTRADASTFMNRLFHFQSHTWCVGKAHLNLDKMDEMQYLRIDFRRPDQPPGKFDWWMHFTAPGLGAANQLDHNYFNFFAPVKGTPFHMQRWNKFMAAFNAFLRAGFTEDKLKEMFPNDSPRPKGLDYRKFRGVSNRARP